jgi:hypothetical protein
MWIQYFPFRRKLNKSLLAPSQANGCQVSART